MATESRDTGYSDALSYAYDLLARRDYPAAAIGDKICSRGHSRDVSDAVVSKLREMGLVDDESYGRRYVDYVTERKPQGRAKIVRDLQRKGLDDDLARRLVDEVIDLDSEVTMALDALQGRGASPSNIGDDPRIQARYYRFLKGRGFPDSVIRKTLRLLDEH